VFSYLAAGRLPFGLSFGRLPAVAMARRQPDSDGKAVAAQISDNTYRELIGQCGMEGPARRNSTSHQYLSKLNVWDCRGAVREARSEHP
jgi:hypothetical protein